MTRGPRPFIGCTVLLTAAVMFPAGLWVAGTLRPAAPSPAANSGASTRAAPAFRNPYSAEVRNDPYVLTRQRTLVEAMENACRVERQGCAEAVQARSYLDARAAED